jgi:hypothetical protein
MTYRTFEDDDARQWEVWDVHPTIGQRIVPELRAGWLAFRSGDARRRLAPIPKSWETADVRWLRKLLSIADDVSVRERHG